MWTSIASIAAIVFQFAWRFIGNKDARDKIFFELAKGIGKNISQNLQEDLEAQEKELDELKK